MKSLLRMRAWMLAFVVVLLVPTLAFAQAPTPPDPTGLDLGAIISAIQAHQWLALVLVFAVYLRKIFSPGSSFPLTLPVNWRPVFVAAASALIVTLSAMQAGASTQTAALDGLVGLVAGGFLDALCVAIFGSPSATPSLLRSLVMLIDELEGGGPTPPAATKTTTTTTTTSTTSRPPTPPAAARGKLTDKPGPFTFLKEIPMRFRSFALVSFAALAVTCGVACIPAQQGADAAAAVSCVVSHWGQPFAQVEAACLPGQETVLADIIADLISLLGSSDAGSSASASVYANEPAVKAALARRAGK